MGSAQQRARAQLLRPMLNRAKPRRWLPCCHLASSSRHDQRDGLHDAQLQARPVRRPQPE